MPNSTIDDLKKSLSEAASLGILSTGKLKETITTASEILHKQLDDSSLESTTKSIVSGAINSFRNKGEDISKNNEQTNGVDVTNMHGINLEDKQDIKDIEDNVDTSFNNLNQIQANELNSTISSQVEQIIKNTFDKLSSLDRSDEKAFTKLSTIVLTSAVKFSNINETISHKFLNSVMQSIINTSHDFFSKYSAHELNQNLDPIYVESIKKASRFASDDVRDHLFDILAQSISATSLKVREGMVEHFQQVAHESFDKSIDVIEGPFKMGAYLVKEPLTIGASIGQEGLSLAQKAITSIAKGAFKGAKDGIKKVNDAKQEKATEKPIQKFDIKTTTDLGDVEIHATYRED